jgi:ATP-binding cassette subfamily C protein CydCD
VTPPARQGGGLLDRRLARRVRATRRYLAAAVAVGVAGTGCLIAQAVLLASIVDRVLLHHAGAGAVAPDLVALAAATAVRALLAWAGEVAAHHTSAAVTSTLRRQLLRRALDLGPTWLGRAGTGELAVTATQGIDALDSYFARYLPQLVLAAVAPVAILAWVAWADWVSLAVLVVTIAMIPLFMVLLGLAARDRTEAQWRHTAALGARFLDLVQGLPTLRAFGQVAAGRRSIERATDDLRRSTLRTLRVAFLSSFALELLASIGTALVALFLGIRLVDGTVPLSVALAVLVLSPEVYLPLRRAAAEFHASTEGQAAADRILAVLDGAQDGSAVAGDGGRAPAPAALPDPAGSDLALRAVTVRHPGRPLPVLDGVDLVVAPGEHVAVVGESGAGKSTLLSVLLGFTVPDAGAVEVGGTPLARLASADWLRAVAWVPQRPYLVHGTLGENLRLGAPGAGPGRLARAVALAGLAPLVAALPQGLDTPVGEGGATLSAGERQRVAIARAVLRDAPVLLLDEPADHLDAGSEDELRQALEGWLEGRTVVVAAHRRRLVERVDRVLELADGRLRAAAGGPGLAAAGALR